jgi:hypothetical protein
MHPSGHALIPPDHPREDGTGDSTSPRLLNESIHASPAPLSPSLDHPILLPEWLKRFLPIRHRPADLWGQPSLSVKWKRHFPTHLQIMMR